MKKIQKIMLPVLIALCLTIEAIAVDVPGSSMGDVYARSVLNETMSAKAPVTEGTATIILEDGTIVCISGIDRNNLLLSVLEFSINDPSAWNWVKSSIPNQDLLLLPVQIKLEDANGYDVHINSAIITITPPNAYADPCVYNLLSDGNCIKTTSSQSGKTISFSCPTDGYVVITKHPASEGTTTRGDTDVSGSVDACDLIHLMHFLSGESMEISNADIDDDGYIDLIDLVHLMKLLAK